MGKLYVTIPDHLENKFRKKIVDKFGGKQGDVAKAVTEAISLWVQNDDAHLPKPMKQ